MATILLADDEQDIRTLLGIRLRRLGVEIRVVEASDGREALAKAEASPPCLAILDHRMPRMTGAEAASALRERWPDLPIAIFSAFAVPPADTSDASPPVPLFEKTDIDGLMRWVRTRIG